MKRRQILQFAGSMLATLGISQLEIQNKSLHSAKTLAQNTPRKLALLIGINNYSNHSKLRGCITDVQLQKELLINRFGFNPADILLVTDESQIKPTRDGILSSFEEHIIKQAKPGDVVVIHYSGHGSRVVDKDQDEIDGLNSTFIPIDQTIIEQENQKLVSDIMGRTLFLLMSAINTENITVVLDSCYSGGGKRGNLTVRSLTREGDPYEYYPNNQELEYQQKWLSRLNMSEA
ncbi:MAG: caspase family protein [Crocosphaera sp.]|nr:caspase family protein [Crocosphaera sp.]